MAHGVYQIPSCIPGNETGNESNFHFLEMSLRFFISTALGMFIAYYWTKLQLPVHSIQYIRSHTVVSTYYKYQFSIQMN